MMASMVAALKRHKPSATTATTTTKIRALRLLEEPMEDDPVLDEMRKKQQQSSSSSSSPRDEIFQQFPMMDKREKALARTQAGNKNIVRLFLALESLWDNEFLEQEAKLRNNNNNNNNNHYYYDYVLILRDDTLWLDDFDLQRVVATDPTADAYVLSCDARTPTMLPPEINDHGILIKRHKASVLGRYVSAMASVDLQECHNHVQKWVGEDRGCNSEMILKHVLEHHDIKTKLVPQSLLPFERAVLVDGKSQGSSLSSSSSLRQGGNHHKAEDFYCYHKFCQSVDQPLVLPSEIQQCKELSFSER